jgi:hypothetical protein
MGCRYFILREAFIKFEEEDGERQIRIADFGMRKLEPSIPKSAIPNPQ